MGKSTLGLVVGWRVAESGKCQAGVVKVDLREAFSFDEVLGRFCGTLGLAMVCVRFNKVFKRQPVQQGDHDLTSKRS